MFEYLSMLCVMIATKNSRFSVSSQQNQQKSITKIQPLQHNITINTNTNNQLQQQHHQPAASETNQEQYLDKHETRSEKRAVASSAASATTQAKQVQQQLYTNQDHELLLTKKPNSGADGASGNTLTATTCCSVKIQQKQQKFLAAAAKSANCSSGYNSSSSLSSPPNISRVTTATSAVASDTTNHQHQHHYHHHNHHQHHHQHQHQQNHHSNHNQQHRNNPNLNNTTSTTTTTLTSPNNTTQLHQTYPYHTSSSNNYNFAANIKTPTTTQFEENSSKQQLHHQRKREESSISSSSSSSSTSNTHIIGFKNNNNINQNNFIINNTGGIQQQPLLQRHPNYNNFNININQQQHQNQLLFQQQHNHNHNHHTHTMAHYKFHNDCQSSVLTYEQVKRLDFVMDQTVPIHGRGNFPTLYVKLKELIRLVKYKLQTKHSIEIRDVRLNGGAASYVLAPENSHYNDLDLIFGTDLSNEDQFDVIRDVVLECLKEFYPKEQQESHFHHTRHDGSESIAGYYNGTAKIDGVNLLDEIQPCLCDSSKLDTKGKENNDNQSEQDDTNEDDEAREGQGEGDEDNNNNDNNINNDDEVVVGVNKNNISWDDTKDNTGHSSCIGSLKNNYRQNIKSTISHLNDSHIYDNSQFQHQSYQMPLSNCAIKEAYVHKMVKVNDDDRWSLISLGVQQSEANCCIQTTCSLPATISRNNSNSNVNCLQKGLNQQHFALTNTNENEPQGLKNQTLCAQVVLDDNSAHYVHQQQPQQQHLDQQNHYQHQRKQCPNSIELKFVDRMRRKFEFSVDSFQIILDSLIQFYDYAPQSTIASQKILINSHPSSTMVNTRPLISKRRCAGNCGNQTVLDYNSDINDSGCRDKNKAHGEIYQYNYQHHNHHHNHNSHHNHHITNSRRSKDCYSETKSCIRVLNAPQSYYQLPIEPANSPSISSVASSSGCSSSSSVVSSSSSSLSCDEDHEDFYCDGDSPSSFSASTSSLLSSTTLSLLSSDGLCSDPDLASNHNQHHHGNHHHQRLSNESEKENKLSDMSNIKSKKDDITEESSVAVKSIQKSFESSGAHQTVPKLVRLKNCVECIEQRTCDFELNDRTTCAVISENFYPTVIGRSEYGNFKEALYHLERKLIATRSPEEIRGGGLLKYCNLLVKNYKPTNVYQIRTLERYMCSRFFIDFSDLNQQQAKLESYLANHFSDDPILKFDYLTILHNVVQRSTVCLMNHELRLTLNMIRDLAYEQQEQQEQQQKHHHHQQQQQQQRLQQSLSQQPSKQYQQDQQATIDQGQQQQQLQLQPHYYQQKPVLIQSGVYRVKLVNYTLAKPIAP